MWNPYCFSTPRDYPDSSRLTPLAHVPPHAHRLEETFWAVSDPAHARYGQHLTQKAVTDLVGLPTPTVDAVVSFLRSAGAYNIEVGPHRDAVLFSINAGDAERAFATRLYAYTHAERGVTAVRAGASYSVPASLARSIRLVSGLLRLPVLGGPRIVPDTDGEPVDAAWPADCGSKCKNKVTPGVIAARYSLPTSSSSAVRNGNGNGNGNGTQSSIAVSEFQGQVWDQGDLTRFQTTCGLSFNVTVDHESGTISKGTVCKIPVLGTSKIHYIFSVAKYVH